MRSSKVELALRGLALLIAAGFIVFNIRSVISGPQLPLFIILENTAYSLLLAIPAAVYKRPISPAFLLLASAFMAGRVSRSVVTPTGELAALAIAHAPLLASLMLIALLGFATLLRMRDDEGLKA
ncbi:MAG: hypothetical protein F7B20_00205 [Aeropyrum sp.]|nr:hypothetical protein [Aeropyrum sp.]